ncbi:transcription initiation factor TFIID subunit 11 [Coemansia spiralis]|uniref:Transcription initiation factor TFIID subunit 11 n=2 Tax=Coemansia TaxID=4863 RepID=A0A9W8G3T1_9FUNG|nr:hTAFII28-like protein conserved region-domain-containing protein [Coemansia spiralis]KAJ1987437.1 transcription initiation factor TFIID subunit 11 [Coemansia umbellata]KAJ2619315.1 transcription initiation factor TFIID subunit 11 [Coemansia sp. RSA 1358]KAJ2670221.1 transcription initiation factor TFIID subunit 11 [Coemansia spiralis]
MSSDQSSRSSGLGVAGQPGNSGNANSAQAAATKKRSRVPSSLTPTGILRQRKRRGGASSNGAPSGRGGKQTGGSRSGAQTPTKLRTSISQGSLALQENTSSPGVDKRGRRGSLLGFASSESRVSGDTETQTKRSDSLSVLGKDSSNEHKGKARAASGIVASHEDDDEDEDDDAQLGNDGNEADADEDSVVLIKQSKEEVGELWEQMSDEQQQRYGVYRRTALNKGAMKKLVSNVLNQQVSSTLTFVVAGFSKVFVGEVVERAVQIQQDRGDEGALKPEHLREAYRLYKRESPTAISNSSGFTKRLF